MTIQRLTIAACVALTAAGCATELDGTTDDQLVLDGAAVLDEGVIVGSLDWRDASGLTGTARTAATATGYVSIPMMGSRCSGFLISDDLFMTNHHCVPNAAAAGGVIVNFKYETEWDDSGVVACDEFVGANEALDYAILRCAGAPGETYGHLTLDPTALAINAPIHLLHQQCDFPTRPSCEPTKKLSPGKITAATATRLLHDADMLGGSSGGAIIAPGTTNAIAINNAHVLKDATPQQRGTINVGVPMSTIVPDMQARFPELFKNCAAIPTDGRVIDEDDDCVTLGGEARFWRSIDGAGNDADLVWTGTTNNAVAGNFAEWRLQFATAGRYELAVFIDAATATASRARYTVRHSGGSADVVVDQNAVATSGFVSLGTWSFAAGANHTVRVADNTGDRSQQLVVDGLRVRPATVSSTPPPPPPATCTRVRVTGAEQLNVRPDPNTSRAPVGVLMGGQVVNRTASVTGQVVRGTDVWYVISTTGIAGYISASFATCAN